MINFMRDQGVSKLMPVVDPDKEYEVKHYLVLINSAEYQCRMYNVCLTHFSGRHSMAV